MYLKNSYIHSFFTFQYVSINTARLTRLVWVLPIFTFQYVSINTTLGIFFHPQTLYFTFQYVSINTQQISIKGFCDMTFTFQYVSINTIQSIRSDYVHLPLHSNMFLLIRMKTTIKTRSKQLYIPICFY